MTEDNGRTATVTKGARYIEVDVYRADGRRIGSRAVADREAARRVVARYKVQPSRITEKGF